MIGRAPEADICIPSRGVSRQHSCITVFGETAVIEDLGSKNGTFVGGLEIAGTHTLADGDCIRLGKLATVLRVVVDSSSTMTEASVTQPEQDRPGG